MKVLHTIHRTAAKGFTLMEMMLVLGIIALLVAIGAGTLGDVMGGAEMGAANAQMSTIKTALFQYRTLGGTYPSEAQGLKALVERPSGAPQPRMWKSVIKPEGIVDPWGSPYVYRNPGRINPQGFDLMSIGQDKKEGTDDDVVLK
jgi:general secretion pathway protein G